MKLQIKTTFSFSKLEKALPGIMKELVDESKFVYAEMSVKNITDGLKPLKPASLESRRKGKYWNVKKEDRSKYKTSKTKPLDWTGNLIKSIKIHEQGVIMNEYGLYHNEGIGVPKRKFLALKLDAKSLRSGSYGEKRKQFIKKMYTRIGKALKK